MNALPPRPKHVRHNLWCGGCAKGRRALYEGCSTMELELLRDKALSYVEEHALSPHDPDDKVTVWMDAFDQFSDCVILLSEIGYGDQDFPAFQPSKSLVLLDS